MEPFASPVESAADEMRLHVWIVMSKKVELHIYLLNLFPCAAFRPSLVSKLLQRFSLVIRVQSGCREHKT